MEDYKIWWHVYQVTTEGLFFHCNLLYLLNFIPCVWGNGGDVEWSLQTEERDQGKVKSRIFQRRLEPNGG